MRSPTKATRTTLLGVIVLASFASLFFTPFGALFDEVKEALPWVALGVFISEVLLTLGFAIMASCVGLSGFRGLFKARSELRDLDWATLAERLRTSKVFWTGFWMSVIGGAGDGLVLIAGIGRSLPPTSWGLMLLPFLDLGATYAIRRAIFRGVTDDPQAREAAYG